MSTGAELAIAAAALAVILVFTWSYRYVGRRFGPQIPTASVTRGDARWLAGQRRSRLAGHAEAFTRVAIAAGLTSVAVMVACGVGMVVLAIAAR